MKKLLLLLLLPYFAIAQVSNGREFEVEAIKTTGSQTITNPVYLVTEGVDGTHGKTTATALEKTSNKQNSMAVDGTGVKYPTVDAVNNQANSIVRAVANVGLIDVRNDNFNIFRVDDTTLGVTGTSIGVIFPSNFATPPFAPSDAVKQVPTIAALSLQTFLSYVPTGTQTVMYIGWRDTTQAFELSNISMVQNPNVFQVGIIYLKNVGGVISFLDSATGRTVFPMPDVSQYSNLETTALGYSSSVSISPNANLTVKNTAGSIIGISVNYKGANNDERAVALSNTSSFLRLSPLDANATILPALTTSVNTTNYYNGSAIVTLSANGKASIQRWLLSVRGNLILQVGEAEYANLADAKNAIFTASFTNFLPIGTFVEIARMAAVKTASNLAVDTDAFFAGTGKGGGGGSGSSTASFSTIQGDPYDSATMTTALNAKVSGTGTSNIVSKWSASGVQSNSNISDTGTAIVLGVAGASNTTQINGLTTIKGTVASDTAPLGAELLTTASGTNWTGTGWATGYTHTAGSTAVLTGVDAIANATYYQTVITITGRTAGTVTVAFGGYSSGAISASLTVAPLTTSTAVLTVTPTTDFNGTIVLSIKSIGSSSSIISLKNSSDGIVSNFRYISNNSFNSINGGSRLTTGLGNCGLGGSTFTAITTGVFNTGLGLGALDFLTIGSLNTGVGSSSLGKLITGGRNVSVGNSSLSNITDSSFNVALGNDAGRYLNDKSTSLTSITNSILIGQSTSPLNQNDLNEVVIGSNANGLGSNTSVLGNSSTLQTHLWGRLTLGSTTTDNGVDRLQVSGTAISTAWKTTGGLTTQFIDGTGALQNKSIFQNAITGLTTNYLPKWNGSTFVNTLVFDNGTNVGIGTASGGQTLSVNGTISATGIIYSNFFGGFTGGDVVLSTNTSGASDLIFRTTLTDRFTIKGSGNVLINTPTDNGVDIVQVNGTISASPATLSNQVVVKSQLDALVTSGNHNPVANTLNNCTISIISGTYTKIGNIVTANYNFQGSTTVTAGTTCSFVVPLPIIKTTAQTFMSIGSGAQSTSGVQQIQAVVADIYSTSSVQVRYTSGGINTMSGNYTIMYDTTK
jgi:hypothetical protein